MKVLFYRYNSICEPDFIEAFKTIGLEVSEIKEEMYRKSIPAEERVKLLLERLVSDTPLFVFSIDYFPFISIVCEKAGYIYVALSVDCPVAEIYSSTIRNSCNRLYLFDRNQYESVVKENPDHIRYMPLGAAVERMNNIPFPNRYEFEVSFIGSLYNEKDRYALLKKSGLIEKEALEHMEALIEKQRKVPGLDIIEEGISDDDINSLKNADPSFYSDPDAVNDIDKYIAVNNYLGNHLTSLDRIDILNRLAEELPEGYVHLFTRSETDVLNKKVVVHEGVNTLTEMPVVFRKSCINLNLTSRTIRCGIPQRVWDIVGAGAFCLTDHVPVLDGVLDAQKYVGTFDSHEEISEKVKFYLQDTDLREQITGDGYGLVSKTHTVLLRALEMVKDVLSEHQ